MPPPPLREPRMRRWTELWYQIGGGLHRHYDEDFFDRWTRVTFYVDESSYASMDYHEDPDLPLPVDA